jgi:hypothetical protein
MGRRRCRRRSLLRRGGGQKAAPAPLALAGRGARQGRYNRPRGASHATYVKQPTTAEHNSNLQPGHATYVKQPTTAEHNSNLGPAAYGLLHRGLGGRWAQGAAERRGGGAAPRSWALGGRRAAVASALPAGKALARLWLCASLPSAQAAAIVVAGLPPAGWRGATKVAIAPTNPDQV